MVLKLNRLYKHNGRRKCKRAKLGLKVGECYTSLHSQHTKNGCIYGIIGLLIMSLSKCKMQKGLIKRKNTFNLLMFSMFCEGPLD